MKFRSRSVVVEAEQYDGSRTHHEMCEGVCRWGRPDCVPEPHVHTARGDVVPVREGDWVIREPIGPGYYPCDPAVFEQKYERAE